MCHPWLVESSWFGPASWVQFFKSLAKGKSCYPDGMDSFHRLNLGHFTYHSNRQYKFCVRYIWGHYYRHHLYFKCQVTRVIWQLYHPHRLSRKLGLLVWKTSLESTPMMVLNRDLLLVYKFQKFRRGGGQGHWAHGQFFFHKWVSYSSKFVSNYKYALDL